MEKSGEGSSPSKSWKGVWCTFGPTTWTWSRLWRLCRLWGSWGLKWRWFHSIEDKDARTSWRAGSTWLVSSITTSSPKPETSWWSTCSSPEFRATWCSVGPAASSLYFPRPGPSSPSSSSSLSPPSPSWSSSLDGCLFLLADGFGLVCGALSLLPSAFFCSWLWLSPSWPFRIAWHMNSGKLWFIMSQNNFFTKQQKNKVHLCNNQEPSSLRAFPSSSASIVFSWGHGHVMRLCLSTICKCAVHRHPCSPRHAEPTSDQWHHFRTFVWKPFSCPLPQSSQDPSSSVWPKR